MFADGASCSSSAYWCNRIERVDMAIYIEMNDDGEREKEIDVAMLRC